MSKATLADTFSVHVKPSLDGKMVIRKKTASQTSSKLKARQNAFGDAARAGKLSKAVHDKLVSEGKCPTKKVYSVKDGKYEDKSVCPIKLMASGLKEAAKSI